MSTTNINDLPDIELLSRLANQLFKAPPGKEGSLPGKSPTVDPKDYYADYEGYPRKTGNLYSSPLSPAVANPAAAPSISGAGISPGSAIQHVDHIDLPNPGNQAHPGNPFGAINQFPGSAGNINPASLSNNAVFLNAGNNPYLAAHQGISPGFIPSHGVSGFPGVKQPLDTQGLNPVYQGYPGDGGNTYFNPPGPHTANPAIPPSLPGTGVPPDAPIQRVKHADQKNKDNNIIKKPFGNINETPASLGNTGKGAPKTIINYSDTKNADPKPYNGHPAGSGNVPQSVAGSGKSPAAPHQYTDFNINDPQTSLPDPHFADGKVPNSVAGSGRSPSLQNQNKPVAKQEIPYSKENRFEQGLPEALASINLFNITPQIPVIFEESSFYFLPKHYLLQPYHEYRSHSPDTLLATKAQVGAVPPLDVNLIKKDFPILQERINGRPLIWLDNAATTQKPKQVIDRISYFYEHENSNIHRAAHELAARATDAFEAARGKVQQFLNAASTNEIVFVRGTTEAINLVAKSWGEQFLQAGDEIILTHLEHHANIVPWQQLAAKKSLKIKVAPVDDDGQVILDEYAKLLGPKVKLVSFAHVSNALGTITPAKQIIDMAHGAGAKVLLDGAQSVSHMRVDLQQLNPDWFVFSGHKIYGPTGIGVLYGKEDLLNVTQPWQGGGNMIKDVTFEHTIFHNAPGRFEAGTGNIADAVGLGAAIDYVSKIGIDLIDQYEHYLLLYATRLLKQVPGLRLIGTAPDKASVLSFVLDGHKSEEVGTALNEEGIAVRAGHHCAQPILRRFGIETTVRPSLAFYNECTDIDKLFNTLVKLINN